MFRDLLIVVFTIAIIYHVYLYTLHLNIEALSVYKPCKLWNDMQINNQGLKNQQ